MSDDDSTFNLVRPIFSTAASAQSDTDASHTLLNFLAVVQSLDISILPITWQATDAPLGAGGTSKISQAKISDKASFAFKRVSDRDKISESEDTVFSILSREISILTAFDQRSTTKTGALQGICWDVSHGGNDYHTDDTVANLPHEDKVWPALVFQATQHGDLYHFATTAEGRVMSLGDRLDFCLLIGGEIAHMHDNNLIHGDIKPQNILVYPSEHRFEPRTIDFGYSSHYVTEEDRILVPKSWPWYAPERDDYDSFRPIQARRMDVFSFSMLFFWLMFEKCLSGIGLLPQSASWANQYLTTDDQRTRLETALERLKQDDRLATLAVLFVEAEVSLDVKRRQVLVDFFRTCLSKEPSLRDDNLGNMIARLHCKENVEWFRKYDLKLKERFKQASQDSTWGFSLLRFLEDFYQADYRVRWAIRQCLEAQAQLLTSGKESSVPQIPDQLAFCYKIGFGCQRSDRLAQLWSQKACSTTANFDHGIKSLRLVLDNFRDSERTSFYGILREKGLLSEMLYMDHCYEHGKLEKSVQELSQELGSIERFTGIHNPLWLFHAQKLVHIFETYSHRAAFENLSLTEAPGKSFDLNMSLSHLKARIVESKSRQTKLPDIYQANMNSGQLDDAIQVCLETIRSTIASRSLKEICDAVSQDGFILNPSIEAHMDLLEEQAMSMLNDAELNPKNEFYEDSPGAMTALRILALIHRSRNDWNDVEAFETRVYIMQKNGYDLADPGAINDMFNLAETHQRLGREWTAYELLRDLADAVCRQRGDEDEVTLECTSMVAYALQKQARLEDAAKLHNQVALVRFRAGDLESFKPLQGSTASNAPGPDSPDGTLHQGGDDDGDSDDDNDDDASEPHLDFTVVIIPDEVLPQGWVAQQDEEGRAYYWNCNTNEGSRKMPHLRHALYVVPEGCKWRKTRKGRTYWVNESTRERRYRRPQYLPRGWERRVDDDDRIYWYDPIRQIATRDRPLFDPAGWEPKLDHLNRLHYIDHADNTKHWSLPKPVNVWEHIPYNFTDAWIFRLDHERRPFWVWENPPWISEDSDSTKSSIAELLEEAEQIKARMEAETQGGESSKQARSD